MDARVDEAVGKDEESVYITEEYIAELEKEMITAAESLEFERAAALRDRVTQLKDQVGQKLSAASVESYQAKGRKGRKGRRGGGPKKGTKVPRPKRST